MINPITRHGHSTGCTMGHALAWCWVPIMGVSGIIAGTAFMHMVGFALLWWFSFSFTKQRKAP